MSKIIYNKKGYPVFICDEVLSYSKYVFGACHVPRINKTPQGYCNISFKGKTYGAHVFWWLLCGNEIPYGYCIDHLCRNRACCNENHLRCVTKQINAFENKQSKYKFNPPVL